MDDVDMIFGSNPVGGNMSDTVATGLEPVKASEQPWKWSWLTSVIGGFGVEKPTASDGSVDADDWAAKHVKK